MKFSKFSVLISILCSISLVSCAPAAVRNVKSNKGLECSCSPEKLVVVNDTVKANVTMVFPEGYFTPTAMLVVTPTLVFDGGKRVGKPVLFQGEEIRANYKTVPQSGATHSFDVAFGFVDGMEQSYLELGLVMMVGQGKYNLQSVKIADGCNVTARLADRSGFFSFKEDGYERISHFEAETTIQYAVNSDYVRDNLANRTAITAYRQAIADFTADERFKVTGTEVVAYASPEGGVEFNADLSDRRAGSAVGALANITKAPAPDSISQRGLGQDWEGFKLAVEQSEIEDRHLILRLLEMYDDPVKREEEIRNLAEIYQELKTEVFPELRRATYIVKADMVGYSDEQLEFLAEHDLASLSETEILRAATLAEDPQTKDFYYRVATQRFQSDKAFFNLAILSLQKGDDAVCSAYLGSLPGDDPDVLNAKGVLALRKGQTGRAKELFTLADTQVSRLNLGAVLILEGEYAQAAECLEGTGTFNEALANVMCGEYGKAAALLGEDGSAREMYLRAVVCARQKDAQGVAKYLKLAGKDENYQKKAAKDVEFVDYR